MSGGSRRLAILLVVAALVAVGVGAYVLWPRDVDEDLPNLAEALMPVSSAVDGYLNFSDAPIDLDGKALLDRATAHNPKLLERFAGYVVLARRDGLASSVLVCDKDGTRALMEDSGCTGGKFDARLWDSPAPLPCDFQLDLKQVCKAQ